MPTSFLTCTPKQLPRELLEAAAETAVRINPVNHPRLDRLASLRSGVAPTRMEIAIMTSAYWGTGGVHLTVGFLDNPESALRTRILLHMNAWAKKANVKFVYTTGHADVRISRVGGKDGGYWSYVGTDIKHIAAKEATMNLEAFTMKTSESEFHRVVRHETGHTLGSPHEHMRRELVDLIDPAKAIAFFGQTQGWTPDEVRQQVLTPIEESSIRGTPHADPKSIMCYQIPGSITKNGQPILGGKDIDKLDYEFMAVVYPKPVARKPKRGKKRTPGSARRSPAAKRRSRSAKR
jgi:astacin (peptidase family M12A)